MQIFVNYHQRSGGNLVDGHAILGSGLFLTTWQTPTLGFRKQERQLRTGSTHSTGGCLRSIAQRTRSGACSYWIGTLFQCSDAVSGMRATASSCKKPAVAVPSFFLGKWPNRENA